MPLNFLKHGANSQRGPHYGAIAGHWPNQRRFIIERTPQGDWRYEAMRHVPGVGFETFLVANTRTLKAAKAECDDIANPAPAARSASSFTDA